MIAVIPARYSSTRLPGKLLCDIAGKPLILHTLDQTSKAARVMRVIVATDDSRIFDVVTGYGAEAVMTGGIHESGSDRIAEVAEGLPAGSIIVNVQGDEPMISPDTIDMAIDAMIGDDSPDIVTTSEPINDISELMNGNVVKVVTDQAGFAIYFSRSPIPYPREATMRNGSPDAALQNEPELLSLFRKHTGLYVYRREFVIKFSNMEPSRLERIEMLEQLRALENGARIRVVEVSDSSIGVDTAEDLERVKRLLETNE
ncbi:3-deoxy-manno-octulosonate cytidylyltransferase [soil metagenome]